MRCRTEFSELRLPPAQVAHVPPRKRSLLGIGDDAPQLRELGRQLLVVRRPDRPEAQGAGAALLQPGQHARRLGVLERQPEPERGELLGLLADVRAKLRRAERDAVVVQQAHAGPERGVGARALAVREREQGARMLGAHAKADRVARADSDVLEGPSRSGGFTESERDPRSEQVRVERGHGPAGGGQGGGRASCGSEPLGRGTVLEECGSECGGASESGPPWPALARERFRGRLGLGSGGLEVAADEGRLGQHQARLGDLQCHRPARELGDGLLGCRPRLGDEPHVEQQLAAVAHPVRERHALRAAPLLRAVVVVQRRRHVTAPGRHPADVVLDLGERQVEIELRVEASGRDEVFLGGGERPAIRVDQPAVVQRTCFPEPVAVPAEDDECAAVAVQCLVEPMMVVEEDGALQLEPRARHAAERRCLQLSISRKAPRESPV